MKMEPEVAWDKIMKEMPNSIRLEAVKAKLMRARFLALLEEGFTEPQAVELCKDILK